MNDITVNGLLSAEQLALFRGYAGRAFTLDELRELFDHIDVLTDELGIMERAECSLLASIERVEAERDEYEDSANYANALISYYEAGTLAEHLQVEVDELKRQLAAAEADAKAKLVETRNQAENPAIDHGMGILADALVQRLQIAERIIGEKL